MGAGSVCKGRRVGGGHQEEGGGGREDVHGWGMSKKRGQGLQGEPLIATVIECAGYPT